jgi:hypothetical protein
LTNAADGSTSVSTRNVNSIEDNLDSLWGELLTIAAPSPSTLKVLTATSLTRAAPKGEKEHATALTSCHLDSLSIQLRYTVQLHKGENDDH